MPFLMPFRQSCCVSKSCIKADYSAPWCCRQPEWTAISLDSFPARQTHGYTSTVFWNSEQGLLSFFFWGGNREMTSAKKTTMIMVVMMVMMMMVIKQCTKRPVWGLSSKIIVVNANRPQFFFQQILQGTTAHSHFCLACLFVWIM